MSAQTRRTQDHDVIQQWAQERGGMPARRNGELHIEFDAEADPISWEEWFERFDEDELCFLYQEERVGGAESDFFKLVPPH